MNKRQRLRLKLLEDLHQFEEYDNIELPAAFVIDTIFSDISLITWCGAANVSFEINTNPDPAFRAPSTIIFRLKPVLPEPDYEDSDL